jgi:SAM-dependent methyltransferase
MPTLNVGCANDPFGDVKVDIRFKTQTGSPSHPNVIADAHHLPFRDGSFEYVRCWHVLEHLKNPHQALRELQRVARHGDIRFPFDDGLKREALWGISILRPMIFWGAMKTRMLHAHLWVIHPDSLSHRGQVRLNYHRLFVPIGKRARYFQGHAFPTVKREWVLTY